MNKKTVLVTGASRGIGKACALKFAAEGYHVFLNCRKSWKDLHDVKTQIDEMLQTQTMCRKSLTRYISPVTVLMY